MKRSNSLLHEHRSGLQRSGSVNLLPYEEAIALPGYISVYAFGPDAVEQILASGTTAGLRGKALGARMVYLDIDDNDQAADAAEAKLDSLGLAYERYNSGNRGFHFHIPCEELVRVDVPYRVKSWVKQVFGNTDESIYKTSGIIRTPGTYHHRRQGSRKVLVSSGAGKLLDLLTVESVIPTNYVQLDEDQDASVSLDRLWLQPSFSGGRNQEIYRRAFLCRLAGHGVDDAVGMLLDYNGLMVHPPLGSQEVISATRSAYRE